LVRHAVSAPASPSGERIAAIAVSLGALLALLPANLRAAGLAHFAAAATSGVCTAVGTNENAAGIVDSGGAVTR
jgi:hypothetical protein